MTPDLLTADEVLGIALLVGTWGLALVFGWDALKQKRKTEQNDRR